MDFLLTRYVFRGVDFQDKLVHPQGHHVARQADITLASVDELNFDALSDQGFESLFTRNKPVIFNYHGYPVELKVRSTLSDDLRGRMLTAGVCSGAAVRA